MKYICSACGYIYDESKEGMPFNKLPDNWVCPLCGASKSLFSAEQDEKKEDKPITPIAIDDDMRKLSPGALAALFSNLARGCEKQYKAKEQALFTEIADYFTRATPEISGADEKLAAILTAQDIDEYYPALRAAAVKYADRGTQRICVWGEKVTGIVRSLLDRYEKEGEAFLENNDIWICTICGFLYVGVAAPSLCPVCKVPDWKFEKIEGRTTA